MSSQTTNLHLVKPADNESADQSIINGNMDIIDSEVALRAKTVNNVLPDENGNILVNEVQFANQIVANDAQQASGEILHRPTAGTVSIASGNAKVVSIQGRRVHTGEQEENIDWHVDPVEREEGVEPIDVEDIDRDTLVAYMQNSGTVTLTYLENGWDVNPTLYGVELCGGDPVVGDKIYIYYTKYSRGLITFATPTALVSTGWNLYNSAGNIYVTRYSERYGFLIGGTYTSLAWSATLTGERTTITPIEGWFNIEADGYLWVTGGTTTGDTPTYILMTHSNWGEGYKGDFQTYTESRVELASAMSYFDYGLMQVGNVCDEINFSTGKAINRIERFAYSAEKIAELETAGTAYEADENYIYAVMDDPESHDLPSGMTGEYAADDHGMEFIEGSTVPVFAQVLYGNNLVDKLRTMPTDVLTTSEQTLTEIQKAQVFTNIGLAIENNLTTTTAGHALDAKQGKALKDAIRPDSHTITSSYSGNVNNLDYGAVYTTTSAPNTPTAHNYFVVTYTASSSTAFQIAFRGSGATAWFRTKLSGTWNAWKQFTVA